MAVTLEQTIAQKQHSWLSGILNSQAFWVLIAILLLRPTGLFGEKP